MTPDVASEELKVRKHFANYIMSLGEDPAVVIGPDHEVRQFATRHILSRPLVTQIIRPWMRLIEDI